MTVGLKEQIVRDAKSFAEARARHRWKIPERYNPCVDCLDRNSDRAGATAMFYQESGGHSRCYSFGEIIEASSRFANALRALGIGRGDVVAIQGAQRPETAIAHMAIYRLGAVALPMSKLFGDDALRYRLAHSGARAIVAEPGAADRLGSLRTDLPELRHVIVTAKSGVSKSLLKPGMYTSAFPAVNHADWNKSAALLRNLDKLRDRIKALEAAAAADAPGNKA